MSAVKLSEIEDADKLATKEQLDNAIARLENRMDARFNALEVRFNAIDAKFSAQRILLIVAVIGILAQIVNAWLIHSPK